MGDGRGWTWGETGEGKERVSHALNKQVLNTYYVLYALFGNCLFSKPGAGWSVILVPGPTLPDLREPSYLWRWRVLGG